MKRTTRSAAALVSTTVLAGAGIAAAVTGVSGPPAPAASSRSTSPASSSDPALSAAVQELLSRSAALHGRLDATHHQLRVLDRRLHVERRMATRLANRPPAPAVAPAQSPPELQTPSAPQVHAQTRASSGAGTTSVHTTTRASAGGAAPRAHTTTRASGGGAPRAHTTTRASGAGSPRVHTSTRASAGHGEEHDSERGHDD